jgi:hypothetical protein
MNFLARFAAIERECEEEDKEESNKKQLDHGAIFNNPPASLPSEEATWIEKKITLKVEDKVKLRTNIVKVVPLSTLVWATLLNIRGGSAYVFARICTQPETAHYRFHDEDLNEDGLIPEGKVVVEYFSLPDNFPQYAIKEPSTLRAYNEPIGAIRKQSLGPRDQWHAENATHFLKTVLRRKYASNLAQYIYDQASAVANEFLRSVLSSPSKTRVSFALTDFHCNTRQKMIPLPLGIQKMI